MLLPSVAIAFLVGLIWIDHAMLCSCLTHMERRMMHPEQRKKRRQRSFTQGKAKWQLVVTCLMVVFYFLYPSLMQQIASINTCETYDIGGSTPGVPGTFLCRGGRRGGGLQ